MTEVFAGFLYRCNFHAFCLSFGSFLLFYLGVLILDFKDMGLAAI